MKRNLKRILTTIIFFTIILLLIGTCINFVFNKMVISTENRKTALTTPDIGQHLLTTVQQEGDKYVVYRGEEKQLYFKENKLSGYLVTAIGNHTGNTYTPPTQFGHTYSINVFGPIINIDAETCPNELITQLTIPESIVYVKPDIFASEVFTSVRTIDYNVKNLDQSGYAFYNTDPSKSTIFGISESGKVKDSPVLAIRVGEGVTIIPKSFALGANKLSVVNLPSTLREIQDYAFYGCTAMNTLVLPDSLTTIGEHVFEGNTSLQTIYVPRSVTHIGSRNFRNCPNLVMRCYADSYAHNYAKTGGITYELIDGKDVKTMEIAAQPQKTTYIENYERLDLTGGSIKVTYKDGTTANIMMTSPEVEKSAFDNTTPGTKTIQLTYKGQTININVEVVAKTAQSIRVSKKPNKTTYKQNSENLDLTGGQITVTYNNATEDTKNMGDTNISVTGFSNTTLGKKELNVSYAGQNTKFDVEIIQNINYQQSGSGENAGITITGKGNENNTQIEIPNNINNISVKEIGNEAFANRTDLEKIEIPDSVTTIADNAFNGSENVIIVCNPNSTAEQYAKSHDIGYIYKGKTINNITVKANPTKTTYNKNATSIDLTGGKIAVNYTDGSTSTLKMTSAGVQVSGFNSSSVGTNKITVTYAGATVQFNVNITGGASEGEAISGDINGNGKADATDLLLIKRHIIAQGKKEWILTDDKFKAGDMNSDNKIDATDLLLLKRKIVNM